MAFLGEFGAAVRELEPERERDTFRFMGEDFTVEQTVPEMLMLQLAAGITGKIGDMEAIAAVWETWRTALTKPSFTRFDEEKGEEVTVAADESQWNKFYRLAVDRRASLRSLMGLTDALFGMQSGRPTEEPSGSSPGRSATSPSSKPSSSHPAAAHLTPVSELLAGSPA